MSRHPQFLVVCIIFQVGCQNTRQNNGQDGGQDGRQNGGQDGGQDGRQNGGQYGYHLLHCG